jgi:TolB-like protein/Tfp pilus assembly protein PilF
MASLIPGFEYDIFVSYRSKDNRGDRWVSKFVESLQEELDSTFKEEISIYFDEKQDETRETGLSDVSPGEKLKCAVFIPVISNTYCDTRSLTWENEFRAFASLASGDKAGLKVRLPDGNVGSRILPVRIHELSADDIRECESVLGGVMRGVEFIYREQGVNRPLTTADDERKNLSGTKYRNQINRVANAIYDIITGMRSGPLNTGPVSTKTAEKPAIPPARKSSIAVLPFVDMSPGHDQEYFCDGVTEEIINALVHVEGIKVIARTSSFAFKNRQEDIREIGEKLNIETILEGSIRKDREHLRITVQLINVSDGSNIWSERYDREMKDVFEIQDEIALAIVSKLKVKLLGEDKTAISKRYTDNIEAYHLYLKGNFYWQMMTQEGYTKAASYFEMALKKDPNYALSYAGLATIHMFSTAYGDVPPNQAYLKAVEFVNKAINIDSKLAGAYSVMGVINTFHYWNWKEAERNLRHALEINPNSSLIHIFYSLMLTCTGRHEEAIAEAVRAQELDPLSYFVNTFAGVAYAYSGNFDRAVEEYKMTLSINPDYFFAHSQLGMSYFGKSMIKEAVAEYEKAVELSGGNAYSIAFLVFSLYLSGQKKRADGLFEGLKKRAEKEYVPATSFYLIHMVRKEEDLALEWLDRAFRERDSFLLWFRASPILIPRNSKAMELLRVKGL